MEKIWGRETKGVVEIQTLEPLGSGRLAPELPGAWRKCLVSLAPPLTGRARRVPTEKQLASTLHSLSFLAQLFLAFSSLPLYSPGGPGSSAYDHVLRIITSHAPPPPFPPNPRKVNPHPSPAHRPDRILRPNEKRPQPRQGEGKYFSLLLVRPLEFHRTLSRNSTNTRFGVPRSGWRRNGPWHCFGPRHRHTGPSHS